MAAVSCVFGSYLRSGMAQPPAAPRPVRPYGTPDKFNGSRNSDFVAWEQHFGQVSRVNQWTAQDQATYLPLYLTENAQSYYQSIPQATQGNAVNVLQALRDRFAPAGRVDAYRAELKARRQRQEEPISDYCEAVRRLARMAYPTLDPAVQDTLGKDQFIDGLDSRELRMEVRRARPATLDAALQSALTSLAILSTDLPLPPPPPAIVCAAAPDPGIKELINRMAALEEKLASMTERNSRPRRRACYNCGSEQHFVANCPTGRHRRQGN